MFRITLAALALAALAAGGAAAGNRAHTQTFADPAGDAGAAPDITEVTVSNDDAGRLTFRLVFANRGRLDGDDEVGLAFDADLRRDTGTSSGFDHVLTMTPDGLLLLRYDPDDGWERAIRQPEVALAWNDDGFTVSLAREALGTTGGFRFYGLSWDNEDDEGGDAAPDGDDVWTYAVRMPFALTVARRTADDLVDHAPHAGETYLLAMRVIRDDTSATVRSGRITCSARVGIGKPLPQPHSLFVPYRIGQVDRTHAACVWSVPATARGRTLVATITLTLSGKTATRKVMAKIL